MQMSGVFVLNNSAVMNASLRAETGVTVQSSCWAYIYARRITREQLFGIYIYAFRSRRDIGSRFHIRHSSGWITAVGGSHHRDVPYVGSGQTNRGVSAVM